MNDTRLRRRCLIAAVSFLVGAAIGSSAVHLIRHAQPASPHSPHRAPAMSQNTETTMISEREAVLREREAFVKGALRDSLVCRQTAIRIAASEFPLPKVTRPRVVPDPLGNGYEFRAIDGRIESRRASRECATRWSPFEELELTANRVAMWADLLANPTEEVDADA